MPKHSVITGHTMISSVKWTIRIENGYVQVKRDQIVQMDLSIVDMEKLRAMIAEAMAEL